MTWSIEPAMPSDAAAVRLLLPTVDASLEDPLVLVARLAEHRRVVAAAALWPITARTNPTAVPCAIHVGVNWRRRKIGSALLAAMEPIARDWGTAALCSWSAARCGSPEHQAWRCLGFVDSAVMRSYEAPVSDYLKRHMELLDWCRSTGRIPPGARSFRPGREHASAVAQLQAEGLGGMAWHTMQGFRAAAGTASDFSMAVADGQRLVGLIVARAVSSETLHIHAHVIAADYREGWVQAMLHHDFMHSVVAAGFKKFTFEAGEAHTVTRKNARRIGATLLAERTTMVRMIKAPSAEA
jgi:GNAT superfamily N-acetyltransferase